MFAIRTPSSIFVRIYGGLLLVISMVALSTYLLIQVVNDYRAAEYRESMATGFFRLVAVGIERQPPCLKVEPSFVSMCNIIMLTYLAWFQPKSSYTLKQG